MYTEDIPDYGDVMTVKDFNEACASNCFIDYDGHGNPAKGGLMSNMIIIPSKRHKIPSDATHIVWYNR